MSLKNSAFFKINLANKNPQKKILILSIWYKKK